MVPDSIDISGPLKLLAETYPDNEVYIQVFGNMKKGMGENFFACVSTFGCHGTFGDTALIAVHNCIKSNGNRDTRAKLQAKLDKLRDEMQETRKSLDRLNNVSPAWSPLIESHEPPDATIAKQKDK